MATKSNFNDELTEIWEKMLKIIIKMSGLVMRVIYMRVFI